MRRQELHSEEEAEEDEEEGDKDEWEEQQIRKAMGGLTTATAAAATTDLAMMMRGPQVALMPPQPFSIAQQDEVRAVPIKRPVTYNLQGIKGRLKER